MVPVHGQQKNLCNSSPKCEEWPITMIMGLRPYYPRRLHHLLVGYRSCSSNCQLVIVVLHGDRSGYHGLAVDAYH